MNTEAPDHTIIGKKKVKKMAPDFKQEENAHEENLELKTELSDLKKLEDEVKTSNNYKADAQKYIEKNLFLSGNPQEQEYYKNATKVLSNEGLDHLYQKTDFQGPDVVIFPIIDKEKNEFSIAYMSMLFCGKTISYPLENGKIPDNISFGLGTVGNEKLKLERNTKDNILTKPAEVSNAEKEAQKGGFQSFLDMCIKYILGSLFGVSTPIGFSESIREQTIDTRKGKEIEDIKKHIEKIEYDLKHAVYSVDRIIKLTFEKSLLEDFVKQKEGQSINPIKELQSRAEIGDLMFIDKDESGFGFQGKLGERALGDTGEIKGFSHVVIITSTDPFEFSHATMSGPDGKSGVYREDLKTYSKKYKFDAMLVKTNISADQRGKILEQCQTQEGKRQYDKKSAITEFAFGKNMGSDAVNCSEYVGEILSSINPSFLDADNKAIPNKLLESQHLFTPSYTTTINE